MRPPKSVLALMAVAAVLTACGSGASTTSTTAASSPTTSVAGAVDPNAPETNPPGDIPDNQVFIPYRATSGDFTVKVPEGWSQSSDGSAVVFTDNFNSVRIEQTQASQPPTVDSVTATVVSEIAAAAPNYEAGNVESVSRNAGDAILVTYRTDSAPNEVTGKVIHLDVERYEFFSNGRLVTLTLSGPQGADNVDPWRIVTDSFQWLQ
jgi:hypothetical protein